MEHNRTAGTVSVAGAARLLGVHPNTVRAWSEQGRLPFVRINQRGDRRYRVSALEAFLDRDSSDTPTADPPRSTRHGTALPGGGSDGGPWTGAPRPADARLADADPRIATADELVAGIAATLDLEIIGHALVDRVMAHFHADRGAVFLREPDGDVIAHAARGLSRRYLAAVEARAPSSPARTAIDGGRVVVVSRRGPGAPGDDQQQRLARAEGFESVTIAPLAADGEVLGAIAIYYDRPRVHHADELETLRLVGLRVGGPIRIARDYARMATWAAQLRSIQQLGIRLSRLGTIREVGTAIATELQELIDYHNVRVYRLVDRVHLVPVSMRGRVGDYVDETAEQLGTTIGHGLTGWVAEHRQALLVHDAARDPRAETIPGTEPGLDESMLLAPMILDDEVLGVLVLSKLGLRQFTEDDLRLLEIYASLAAQAMANVDATERLRDQYAQMARWAAQLRSIQQLGVRLSRLSTVREIGLAIATELRQLIDYHNVRVYRLLPSGELVAVAVRGQVGEYVDETPEQLRVRIGQGITGWVAQHATAQRVDDAAHDPRVLTIPGTDADLEESMLVAPMIYEDEVLGVLVLAKLGLRQFSQDDLRLLEIYASFAAHAMASADATERLRAQSAALAHQLRSQQVLLQITGSILTTLDPRRVLDQIAQGLAALVRHDSLAIAELDASNGTLRTLVAVGAGADRLAPEALRGDRGLAAWVMQHDEPQLIRDGRSDPRVRAPEGTEPFERSVIAVPLRGRSGPTGVLALERLGAVDRFSEDEFELVKLFAAQVSIALQNAEEHRVVEVRAETDALTGLQNKGTFDQDLAHAVARGEPFSLLMVDLDDFKAVNDARGHQAGDDLLRRIAGWLRGSVRDSDTVSRYGGDEFALILPGTDAGGARTVAEKVRTAIAAAGNADGSRGVSCSIGIATFPEDGASQDSVLLAADRACYASKRSGRGRISTAQDGLALAAEFRLTTPTPVDEPVELAS